MSSIEEANKPSHYILMTVSIIIGIVGVYIRFAGDEAIWSWIGNTLMVVGTVIALKSVFNILGNNNNN